MIKGIIIAIVLLVIVALIISAANDYREGRIRIRFDDFEDDHICEHCGDRINIEHPCFCNKCWNGLIEARKEQSAQSANEKKAET